MNQVIHARVSVHIDTGPEFAATRSAAIPPDYDPDDTRALSIRTVEDCAFDLTEHSFGRSTTRRALVAHAARLLALEAVVHRMRTSTERSELLAIFALSNDQVSLLYGEHPEG